MSGDASFNLAIETSGQVGSVCLGKGSEILGSVRFTHAAGRPSKGAELMPSIDLLCQEQEIKPAQLKEVYVSIGPGSFTGLRIGITTAKMMAQVLGVRIVAVPTINVIAQNAEVFLEPSGSSCGVLGRIAVCLNHKRQTMYAGLFERTADMAPDARWQQVSEPALMTLEELLKAAGRPIWIISSQEKLLEQVPQEQLNGQITLLGADTQIARAQSVYALGRQAAHGVQAGQFVDQVDLTPLYVRPPEAVEIWDKRHGISA
jgi:tRNA threonylcarbamoyladenosine biosynthesis protein TsaB